MIGAHGLAELIDYARRFDTEPPAVEVKSGAGGFPRSIRETLSAFANTDGGTVIIGLDEGTGFRRVELSNAGQYRDQLISIARDNITPPLLVETEVLDFEGGPVVVGEVPPLSVDQRPAYVTASGLPNGSYLRMGDGDRRMTPGEIALVYASRTQPSYDSELVEGATVDDLDAPALSRSLQKIRSDSARLRAASDLVVLHRLGLIDRPASDARVTLGGLLAFGEFPQQFFPQLMILFVAYPPDRRGPERFLDNVTVRGSIPEMVSEALVAVRRNLAARSVITEMGRIDRRDYPMAAVRELLVNALLHRDYSPTTRGTQVQVELHPDRLVVRSPGGLYGGITVDDLGEQGISSSRNMVLAAVFSDTFLPQSDHLIVENRASGIPEVVALLRDNGQRRPRFESSVLSFIVTLNRSELLGPDTREWLQQLTVPHPTAMHDIALAMLRTGDVTNEALREWGADRISAGAVLRDLVESGTAVRLGGRRYARYVLGSVVSANVDPVGPAAEAPRAPAIRDLLSRLGQARTNQLTAESGLSRQAVVVQVNQLIEAGEVEAIGAANNPKRTYRWIGAREASS